jgi:hypothetical protein
VSHADQCGGLTSRDRRRGNFHGRTGFPPQGRARRFGHLDDVRCFQDGHVEAVEIGVTGQLGLQR